MQPPVSPLVPPADAGLAGGSAPRRHWLRWTLLTIVGLAVAYALFVRPFTKPAAAGRGAAGGPMPVTAEPARTADLDVRLVSLGTVTPVSTATVRSRVDGELQKLFFKEGQTVEAGAPLAELDPRPFEVQKMQAEAQQAKDNALLENARVDLKRFQTLLAQDSVAEQQVETQAALVRQYEAALKVDQAQVASAALQLSYAHITAPIPGRIGLRNVDLGNIVHASDAGGIAVITQLHPITVLFSIPQDSVLKVMKRFGTGETMQVEAFDRDGRTRLAAGKLATVDNQIDPATGTVKLRAEFDNTDETLFPNQFVNVQLVVDELKGVTVIPTAGVQRGTVGTYVYVVGANNTVSVRVVETGPSEKGQIVINKGLQPGDVVVVDGVDKLKDGAAVELVSRDTGVPAAAKGGPRTGKRPADGSTNPSH
ncbi:membrane fusion protein, multidrug efflux system [Opitutus sp. GAS368]|nr:membrane fusion protein, multidrug efflux system [Opitutus sp. GAS368]